MFALRRNRSGRGVQASDVGGVGGGFVLPRWLRKPVRVASRLVSGDVEAPRYAATMLTAALLGATGIYGSAIGGHMPAIVQTMTAHSGFAIADIVITGNRETSEIDVLDKVGLDGWTSLVGFDAEAARQRIAVLPWVDSVSVRKVYPRGLVVDLVERKPFAIWQHGRELSLIDEAGRTIVPFSGQRYATLPLFIGVGANTRASVFAAEIDAIPELGSRARAFIRVADRRWDIRLENGITIRLPEHDEDRALADVARLDREQGLLSRDLTSVDMRFEGRLVVKLTPEAVMRREAALEAEGKKRSRAEKKI